MYDDDTTTFFFFFFFLTWRVNSERPRLSMISWGQNARELEESTSGIPVFLVIPVVVCRFASSPSMVEWQKRQVTRPWGDKRATVLGGSQKRQSSFESAAATCWALVSCPWQPCSLFHPSRSSNTFRAFKIFGRMHLFIILLFSREYSQTLLLLSRVAPVRSWWRSIAAITSREQNYIRSHFASISLWTRAS